MIRYALCDRRLDGGALLRGVSCDEDGVFLAGEVPLVMRSLDQRGKALYQRRPTPEINFLFSSGYGPDADFSDRIASLNSIARYMSDGRWVLAKIATVHLRLPDLPNDTARANLLKANRHLALFDRVHCQCGCSVRGDSSAQKRDVSNEPRIPKGQPGGGEWTSEGGGGSAPEPRMIPVQAVPMPIPMPFELPLPPTEITPFPLDIPNGNIREPIPVNPYPDRPDCVEEWAHATKFCDEQRRRGKLKPGYGGFGKDITKCLLGMVSEECGGNSTRA